MDLNKAMIIGRLTADPQVRSTQAGQNVASFGVATSRRWNDRSTGEPREETEFHNTVAFGKLADVCSNYLKKGSRVYVEGRLQTNSWEDQQTGKKMYRTELIMENMIMLDSRGQNSGDQSGGGFSGNNYGKSNFQNSQNQGQGQNQGSYQQSQSQAGQNKKMDIPAAEEIPTINVDDEKEDIKVEDIPF
jgi:single-strand DNA-binding protein